MANIGSCEVRHRNHFHTVCYSRKLQLGYVVPSKLLQDLLNSRLVLKLLHNRVLFPNVALVQNKVAILP